MRNWRQALAESGKQGEKLTGGFKLWRNTDWRLQAMANTDCGVATERTVLRMQNFPERFEDAEFSRTKGKTLSNKNDSKEA
jgi:hypothetical protein